MCEENLLMAFSQFTTLETLFALGLRIESSGKKAWGLFERPGVAFKRLYFVSILQGALRQPFSAKSDSSEKL